MITCAHCMHQERHIRLLSKCPKCGNDAQWFVLEKFAKRLSENIKSALTTLLCE
jgi:DNA polymerase II large subunit